MDTNFKTKVYELIAMVPPGSVTTYGDIAALAGHPSAARTVGQIAHFGPEDLPWHRMVNRNGKLANGFWGGVVAHGQLLSKENIPIKDFNIVNFNAVRWNPKI